MPYMYDLSQFELSEMARVSAQLRQIGRSARSFEHACQLVSEFFWREFVVQDDGQPTFALARCYKTHAFGEMPSALAQFALGVFPDRTLTPSTQCLTLLGTFGDREEWRARHTSSGHQAIPLIDERTVDSLPMVSRMVRALGIDSNNIVKPDPALLLEKHREGFNVFHIENAVDSPHIPAQDFVRASRIRSVIGFGFLTPPASVFVMILFSRQSISHETAQLFKTLALSLKLALLPLLTRNVFDDLGARA
jgi:hypothetical protein